MARPTGLVVGLHPGRDARSMPGLIRSRSPSAPYPDCPFSAPTMGEKGPAEESVSSQNTSSTWPRPVPLRMARSSRSIRMAMLSGMTPRERSLSCEFDAGLRRSSPLEACENEPAADTETVWPETEALPPHTDCPAGRADVPQVSITRNGASPFGGMFCQTDAGAWNPTVRRCCCEAGTVPPDPIRYTGSEQPAMAYAMPQPTPWAPRILR